MSGENPQIKMECDNMRSKEEIQKMIIYYLIDNDMSVNELSEKLKCSKASIYRWMDNKSVLTDKYYIKLEKLFDGYNPNEWNKDKQE